MTTQKKVSRILAAAAFAGLAALTGAAFAAGGGDTAAKHPHKEHWHFSGVFGTFDRAALQRGYQVYRNVCASCHGMNLMSFRNLGQKGGPFFMEEIPNPNDNPIVKAIAAEFDVEDGPNDEGDMFDRPGLPSDRFPEPFPNEAFARVANNGSLPPDLSLLTKARHDGSNYVYALLTGYDEAPHGFEVPFGQYFNPYFEGHLISMAPPLLEGIVTYDDGSPETVEQYAKDVVEFMTWAAEPKAEVRKQMGFMVITYLVILAGLLYWSYKKVWRDVEH